MPVPMLAVSSGVQLVAAASFAYVARVVLARRPDGADASAATAFATWWMALAAYMVMQGAAGLVAAFGGGTIALFLALRFAVIPFLCAAGWGISYYVLFLYTGRARLRFAVAAYYALLAVGFVAVGVLTPPASLNVQPWQATLEPKPAGLNVIYALFAVPPLAATFAYFSLIVRVETAMQRYRVAMVAGAILAWIGSGLAANLGTSPFWRFFTVTVMGLVTAAVVFLAYRPPGFVSARLDPHSLDAFAHERRREERRAEFHRRVGELV